MATVKNLRAKTRPIDNPYETYTCIHPEWGEIERRVLKHYQTPKGEMENPYARVFCAVRSALTYGSWELGDVYCRDIPGYVFEPTVEVTAQ